MHQQFCASFMWGKLSMYFNSAVVISRWSRAIQLHCLWGLFFIFEAGRQLKIPIPSVEQRKKKLSIDGVVVNEWN